MPCWPLPPAQWTSELCLGRNCKQICARQPELDFHLSRLVPKAPPEEEEGDCPRAQHSLCPCAHTHVCTHTRVHTYTSPFLMLAHLAHSTQTD